jgi:putative hydrolase of the HAD superfamily
MHYTTLIFDAFDTVVHINESKLPTYRVDGKAVPTTAPAVHAAYSNVFPKVDFDVFYSAFSQSYIQVATRRRGDLKEIPSQERFKTMLDLLGHPSHEITDTVVEAITKAHMAQLRESFEVRPETIEVLQWAKTRYRTAMISNFGYAPALYDTLDQFGIRSAFETIVVSVEVGWCKPHRMIFDQTFERMRLRPSEALFVGDQIYLDVYGALSCGMDVVWIETARQDSLAWLPTGVEEHMCKPTYTVRSISELVPLLENTGGARAQ